MYSRNIDSFEFKLENKKFIDLLLPWLQSNKEKYDIELISVQKDSAVTLCTENKRELIVVIGGEGSITISGSGSMLKFGDLICVPTYSVRSIANISDNPLYVISLKYRLSSLR
jgi:mannose-6-phosphate isomerase-like protein (cupin superfamily)